MARFLPRLTLVFCCLVGIAGLGSRYATLATTLPDGIRASLADPDAHDGERLVFPVWFVSGVDDAEHYRISRIIKDVRVEGDSAGLSRGQTITVVGDFRAGDSTVVELRHQVHTLRPHKKALSMVGLLLGLAAVPFVLVRGRGGLSPVDPTDPPGRR
ncbi:MAG: hypothetical protein H6742_03960 [Alphaproteobacteria bacterium]|nr:hypothetical protein [Alphaproteobacteria bacterium]